MTAFLCRACSVTLLILAISLGAASGQSGTVASEHFVQSSAEPDAKLYVRERLPADTDPAQLEEAVLFVHGATYPGDTFDLEIEGYDWMTQVAESGMAIYYVDIRGYGRSTRPPAMAEPPEKNAPFSRAVDAAKDVGDALDFVRKRTGADEVNLIGWSWGTVVTGLYTSEDGDKVDKLVLYAPLYDEKKPRWVESMADPENPDRIKAPGAYGTHSAEQARAWWESQIVPEDKSKWREENVFQTWFQTLLAIEPEGAEVLRAPSGARVDVFEIVSGDPIYDASAIDVPTLVIRGAADTFSTHGDSFGLFEELGTDDKLYVVVGDATHWLSLEKNAPLLIQAVQAFLEG